MHGFKRPRFHESTIWGIIEVGFVLHPDQWFVLQDGALCAKDHLITVDVTMRTMPSIHSDGHGAGFSPEFCTTQLWQVSSLGVPQQLGWPTQKTKNTILPHFLINLGCLQFHKLNINLDQLNPAAEREVIQPTHGKSLLSLL